MKGQDPEYCLWPVAHGDIGELRKNGTYRSLPLGILLPQPLHPGTRSGIRQQAGINSITNSENIISNCLEKVEVTIEHLENQLKAKVFDKKDINIIEHTRKVLDLEKVLEQLKNRSAAELANLSFNDLNSFANQLLYQ